MHLALQSSPAPACTIPTVNKHVAGATLHGAEAALPGLPCTFYASNLWNVKTGQNNLEAGPKAALSPTELFAEITRKQFV